MLKHRNIFPVVLTQFYEPNNSIVIKKSLLVVALSTTFVSCTKNPPPYKILGGTSRVSADDAAKSAQAQANSIRGNVIGIASSSYCCGMPTVIEGGSTVGAWEWDVYLLVDSK